VANYAAWNTRALLERRADLESEKNEWGAQMSRAKAASGEFERAKRRAKAAHNELRDIDNELRRRGSS
jgi:hypothetical protein